MIKKIILSLTFDGSRYVIDIGGHNLFVVKSQFWAMCRSLELQFGTRPALSFQIFLKEP
jgi:hypothetical protein